jgi:hypothetical protein
LNKDSFSKKVRRYNKTEPKIIYKRAQKKLRQLAEFYQKAEAGELEPFSFNSVYQLVLHLSELLSVAFL